MTGVHLRRGKFGHRYTGRTQCDDRGRDWSDESTSQSWSKIAGNQHKLAGGKEGFSPRAFRGGVVLLTS